MESLPELENRIAAQDRPKFKWKRPLIWCVVVVLVLVNVYYLATSLLPRWAPQFTRRYIPHPTALARVLATQLEKGDTKGAEETGIKIQRSWFVVNESTDEAIPTPWAQKCFREVFIRGDQWERVAVLMICAALHCPDCLDDILGDFTDEIPKLDSASKEYAALALGSTHARAAIPALEMLLSDAAPEVRLKTVGAISALWIALTGVEDRAKILDLLRAQSRAETDSTVRELILQHVATLRWRAWQGSPRVSPDEELLQFLRSPFKSVRDFLSGDLVAEQFRGRLDAAWYPFLNEAFSTDESAMVRGNCALILILADDPQSEEKLKSIESQCDPKYAPLPLTKEKVFNHLKKFSQFRPAFYYVMRRWNPSWQWEIGG